MAFRIPESLHEITIGQYQKYMAAIEGLETNEAAMMERAIVIFCNISLRDLRSLTRKEVDIITIGMSKALKAFGDDQELVRRFTLDGVEYGFIPNLDTDISYGENKDIVEHIRDGVRSSHKAMAILYRPILKSYKNTYKIEQYKLPVVHEESFRNAPVSILLGAQVFLDFNERVADAYPELFKERNGGGSIQGDDEEGIYQSNWGGYDEVFCLAQGDIRRFDEVTALPLHSCYMYLANNSEKHRIENYRIKKRFNK